MVALQKNSHDPKILERGCDYVSEQYPFRSAIEQSVEDNKLSGYLHP